MSKHTPGPWKARARCVTNDGTQDEMAGLGWNIEGPREPSRGQFSKAADAYLVAAAPDLLEALEGMLNGGGCIDECEHDPPYVNWHSGWCDKVRAVIAKTKPPTTPSKS